jgi:hypothetical protein
MEIMLQYLDDLEDALYAVALSAEQIRRVAAVVLLPALLAALVIGLVLFP